jgi:hypothetical protein
MVDAGKPYLTEQSLTAPSSRCWVVDVDVMILSWDWFLHKWFVEHNTIHFHVIFWLHQFMIYNNPNSLVSEEFYLLGYYAV